MSAIHHPILLCTNGDDHTAPALDYGVWLAGLLHTRVVFLGIQEPGADPGQIEPLIQNAARRLDVQKTPFEIRMDQGDGPEVIARHANAGSFLTVVGPLGRSVWQRLVQGRSFRKMLSHIQSPLFYIRETRQPLKKMLVCLGGLEYSLGVEAFSLDLAKISGASVTVLHVVEPVTMHYPIAMEIRDHWKTVMETDTPQGRHLRRVYEAAKNKGLPIEFHARHGNIVHEIVEEARNGKYDLIAMGSAYSAHSLRHLYMPSVTAEVAEAIVCPILTIRTLIEAEE